MLNSYVTWLEATDLAREIICVFCFHDFEDGVEGLVKSDKIVGVAQLRHALSLSEVTGPKRSDTDGVDGKFEDGLE